MSTYTGTCIKDLDITTPTEGASGTIPEFNDCMRETKKVLKNQNAITTITTDTTLDATHSTIIFNKATAIAATLPTASTVASSTFIKEYYFKNIGVGTATVTGTITLNGTATASPTLVTNDEMRIWTNGTTWYGVRYSATAVANTVSVRDANKDLLDRNSNPLYGMAGEATATSATNATTINMGSVTAGDRILVTVIGITSGSGTTGGATGVTWSGVTGNVCGSIASGNALAMGGSAGLNYTGSATVVFNVTGGGTLTLGGVTANYGSGAPSYTTIVSAFFLKKQ